MKISLEITGTDWSQVISAFEAYTELLKKNFKLTAEDVAEVRLQRAAGVSGYMLAELYGVKPQTIYAIANGKIWRSTYGHN